MIAIIARSFLIGGISRARNACLADYFSPRFVATSGSSRHRLHTKNTFGERHEIHTHQPPYAPEILAGDRCGHSAVAGHHRPRASGSDEAEMLLVVAE